MTAVDGQDGNATLWTDLNIGLSFVLGEIMSLVRQSTCPLSTLEA
jgi:hypothetical protein